MGVREYLSPTGLEEALGGMPTDVGGGRYGGGPEGGHHSCMETQAAGRPGPASSAGDSARKKQEEEGNKEIERKRRGPLDSLALSLKAQFHL